jgi:DNA primase
VTQPERISPAQIEEAKSANLVDLIGTHVKLRRRGKDWWGCCPFHKEKTASFHVTLKFYKCFGCGASGDAISWVRESENLKFDEAIRRLTRSDAPARFCGVRTKPSTRESDDAARTRKAKAIWDDAKPIGGTLAETYLRARGVRLPLSQELRFADGVDHTETGQRLPCMVARLVDERGFCAIQRTFLAPDGGKKADVKPNKKTLGPMGEGAVRLREPGTVLGIAEGIETALSAAQLYQVATWATLSANRLGAIAIPETVWNIIVFADQGEVGMREACKAADAYEERHFAVEIIAPAADFPELQADDFNTVARSVAS